MTTDMQVAPAGATSDYGLANSVARAGSAVSWGAVIAGAVVAAAASLVLFALGSGFGLSTVSPWPNSGVSPAVFTVATAIWLIVMQWIASGLGGYMTGRLRTRWVGTHVHEVFFRDTAHGFLTWALATVIAAGLFGTVTVMAAGAGVHAAAPAVQAATTPPMLDYDVDSLFRSSHGDETPSLAAARVEAARILAAGAADGQVSADDRAYLAQRIATVTGTSASDATQRVDAVVDREQAAMAKATQAADTARKAAAALSIFVGLSLLIGALIASVAAALGGQLRDEHP